MKITIDEEIIQKEGLTLPEALAILLIKTGVDISELFLNMLNKEILTKDLFGKFLVTQRWDDICSTALLKAENDVPKEDELDTLAKKLMEIFPKGKKEGTTSSYWKGNIKDTKLKLRKFFKLYGNHWSDEEIIEATKKYVTSFNGNYTYMRLLKYFIWKDERKIDAEGKMYIEETSDLANILENKGQDTIVNADWTAQLK